MSVVIGNHNISHLVIFLFAIVTVFRQTFQAGNKVVDHFTRVWFASKQFCLARGIFFLTLKWFDRHVNALSNSLASPGYVLKINMRTPGPARCKSEARFCSLSTPEAATYSSNWAFHFFQRYANVAGSPMQSKGKVQGKPHNVTAILVTKCSVCGSIRGTFWQHNNF